MARSSHSMTPINMRLSIKAIGSPNSAQMVDIAAVSLIAFGFDHPPSNFMPILELNIEPNTGAVTHVKVKAAYIID